MPIILRFSVGLFLANALVSLSAATFSVNYVDRDHQLWFVQAIDGQTNCYRICVVTLGADGKPERNFAASEASFSGANWFIKSGREIVFAKDSLEAESVRRIEGNRPDLSFDPGSRAPQDPRVRQFGKVFLFPADSSVGTFSNLSMLRIDEATNVVTYSFAERVVLTNENGRLSFSATNVAMVENPGDSRPPKTMSAREIGRSFP